jgi:hypothetical protein
MNPRDGIVAFDEFTVDIYCNGVTDVTIAGAGEFECADEIKRPSFNANISGAGTLKGNIECDIFNLNISGGGFVTMVGNTKEANITCNTGGGGFGTFGTFGGKNFIMNNATIDIDGSVTAEVNVAEYLNASSTGNSKIGYYGNPQINIRGNRNNVKR